MANKMLIDASHPEETRGVVLRGNRIEEFDFEAASKNPLCGNLYLAQVTRVEPAVPAASHTVSSPSRKSTPTIIRSRSPTGRRCLKTKRASGARRTRTKAAASAA